MPLLLRCGNLRPNISLGVSHTLREGFNVARMGKKNSFTYSEQFFVSFYARLTYALAFPTTHPLRFRALYALGWLRRAVHGARHKMYEAGRNAVAAVVENLSDERANIGKGPDNSSQVWNELSNDILALGEEADVSI